MQTYEWLLRDSITYAVLARGEKDFQLDAELAAVDACDRMDEKFDCVALEVYEVTRRRVDVLMKPKD